MVGEDPRGKVEWRENNIEPPAFHQVHDEAFRFLRTGKIAHPQDLMIRKPGSVAAVQPGTAEHGNLASQFFKRTDERQALLAVPLQDEDVFGTIHGLQYSCAYFSAINCQRYRRSAISFICCASAGKSIVRFRTTSRSEAASVKYSAFPSVVARL